MLILDKIKKEVVRNIPSYFLVIESVGLGRILRSVFSSLFLTNKSGIKVTEIKKLSRHTPLPIYFLLTPEVHKSNDWYGNATWLKKYAGIDDNYSIKAPLEHGSVPTKIIFSQDVETMFPAMLTYSKKRKNYLEKSLGKRVFAIGPYIHYAPNLVSEKKSREEKIRLGKNLLVFTAHSSVDVRNDYDIQNFCKEISRVAKNFDTVRICLYWKDILYGVDEIYRKFGYECVSAGDIFDPLFLPRLKAIINSSTVTMSNSIGTYLGYCVFMGKPHYYVDQKILSSGNKPIIRDSKRLSDSKVTSTIKQAFGKYRETITREQMEIISPEWGFDQIKSPQEIKNILEECELLYKTDLSKKASDGCNFRQIS
ncbi:MAG: hypothetical protein US96_C0005G0017 [Candidatus Woesebacteria bacterium GW2011_GWB1_38_5b]|uniref:Uncharacterized protein n=1 Tax=Candidatus Woesebacteria bacterium GW2011_GWB1_38_5b TaxID=1618569 RepID=A0A0G0MQ02_9BACT|nr:MAG: hypothetical protein US96_C0005G0017 [Candidatus Woesebacteria bacterium GW2011_GWB1_38_5b]